MIIYGTCVGDQDRYESFTLPSIRRIAAPEDLVLSQTGQSGLCRPYNEFIREARSRPDCSALILLHDDVEILDDNFRAKVLRSVAEQSVGIVGVIGGAGLLNSAWWTALRTAGFVYETRGPIRGGVRQADVDIVDGLLLVLSPSAFRSLLFDEENFPAFHAYEVDYCLQARAAGLRVLVRSIAVIHRTKTGYGNEAEWEAASSKIKKKWPRYYPRLNRIKRFLGQLRGKAAYRKEVARVHLLGLRDRWRGRKPGQTALDSSCVEAPLSTVDNPMCPVCHQEVQSDPAYVETRGILDCVSCGTGITWPPPARDVASSGIFDECYGNTRLARRDTWLAEARARLDWLKLYVPGGVLLEVGCATGEFLSVAGDDGYECYGVETSDWAARQARGFGAEVVTGYLGDWMAQYPDTRVDAVVLWHVLEHIPEPSQFLTLAGVVLKPSGRLTIEVPNYGSSAARAKGRDWADASLADHCYHYRPENLRQMLRDAGFDVVDLLEFSPRVYSSTDRWQRLYNQALLDGLPWPSLDFIRVIAVQRGL